MDDVMSAPPYSAVLGKCGSLVTRERGRRRSDAAG